MLDVILFLTAAVLVIAFGWQLLSDVRGMREHREFLSNLELGKEGQRRGCHRRN